MRTQSAIATKLNPDDVTSGPDAVIVRHVYYPSGSKLRHTSFYTCANQLAANHLVEFLSQPS